MSSAMAVDSTTMGNISRKRGPSPSPDDPTVLRGAPLSKRLRGLTLRDNRLRDRITKNSSIQRKQSPASSISSKLQDAGSDLMQMDDSPNKVYVLDLDEEAKSDEGEDSDSEAAKSSMVFLPDIEKKFNKIPLHVLKSGSSSSPTTAAPQQQQTSKDVILYRDPASLIAPAVEQESVRKMILRAREEAKQKIAQEAAAAPILPPTPAPPVLRAPEASIYNYPPPTANIFSFQSDPDAMDMD